jgi:hypothetical protein
VSSPVSTGGQTGEHGAEEHGWVLLPTLVVRSAGFRWDLMDELAYRQSAPLADQLCEELERADALRATLPPGVRLTRGQAARLRNNRPLPPSVPVPGDWAARWADTATAVSEALEAWLVASSADEQAVSGALARLVADPWFRQAIVCSSPRVHRDLARGGSIAPRLRRQVARYAQRVITKCETMSFFGPVNYAQLDAGQAVPAVLAWKGPQVIAARQAYLAAWAFDRLLDSVVAEPGVVATLVPRRTTFAGLPGDDPAVAALTGAADGVRPLGELAAATGLTPAEAAGALHHAVRRGLLTHHLIPPAVEPDHARWLAARLGDPAGAEPAHPDLTHPDVTHPDLTGASRTRAVIDVLDRYPDAGADTKLALQDELHQLLPERQEAGRARTPEAAAPQFYNDRVIITEAACGTLDLTLGGGLAADLRLAVPAALELLAHQAVLTRQRANRALARALGAGRFPLIRVLRDCASLATDPDPWLPGALTAAIEDAGPGVTDLDLATLGLTAIGTAPGGAAAGLSPSLPVLCSADVMVAADDLARYRTGVTPLVIGDLHDAALLTPWALQFHPDAGRLIAERDRAIERCLGPHRAVSVVARRSTGLPPLRFPGPVVEIGTVGDPAERLPLDRLIVQSDGEQATLRLAGPGGPGAGGELFLHNGELDTGVHTALALPRVRPARVPDAAALPRLRYRNVVLSRRRWRLLPGLLTELPAAPSTAPERLELRRALRRNGLPPRFFAKASHQRKPMYIDTDSPLLVDALYRLAAQATSVHATEVLPDGDALWLREGAAGAPGSSAVAAEFRCVYLRPSGFAGSREESRGER